MRRPQEFNRHWLFAPNLQPGENLGAAHTACFTMAFAFACDKAGFATASS